MSNSNSRKKINNAIIAYYGMNDPIMSDQEFDKLFAEEYGTDIEPFAVYQDIFVSDGRKRELLKKMLSLKKVRTKEEAIKWIDKVLAFNSEAVIHFDIKYDGIACLIEVADSEIISASTRGNGSIGEDITYAVQSIPNAVDNFDEDGLHQVELCMSHEDLERLNNYVAENDSSRSLYSNPRNAVAGLVRTSNSKVKQYAQFITIKKHFSPNALGISKKIAKNDSTDTIVDELNEYRSLIESHFVEDKNFILYDGVVLFATDKSGRLLTEMERDELDSCYGFACAWKFANEEKVAVVKDIHWQHGRTKNTPVATFDPPVDFDGVLVSKASLHNADQLKRLGVYIGDSVAIVRSNEVIPYVRKVVSKSEDRIEPPEEPDVALSVKLTLAHVLKTLDVRGSGSVTIDSIANWIEEEFEIDDFSPVDCIEILYDLSSDYEEMQTVVDSFAEKKSRSFCEAISRSMTYADAPTWLTTLGIANCGYKKSLAVLRTFGSFENLLTAIENGELEKEGVGQKLSEALYERKFDIEDLSDYVGSVFGESSLTLDEDSDEELGKVVLTGSLDKPRSEIAEELLNYGYELVSSVTNDCDFVFALEGSTSKKVKDAEKKNVPINFVTCAEDIYKLINTDN